MTTTSSRCRDCAHAGEWSRTPTGRIREKSVRCMFVVLLPPLPFCVELQERRMYVTPTNGAGCPTFQPLPTKP